MLLLPDENKVKNYYSKKRPTRIWLRRVTNFWGLAESSVSKVQQAIKWKRKCVDSRENLFKMCGGFKSNLKPTLSVEVYILVQEKT